MPKAKSALPIIMNPDALRAIVRLYGTETEKRSIVGGDEKLDLIVLFLAGQVSRIEIESKCPEFFH